MCEGQIHKEQNDFLSSLSLSIISKHCILTDAKYYTLIQMFKKLQKKIIKIITFSSYKAETAPFLKKLSVLSIDNINNKAIAIFMFWYIFNNGLPISFQNFFKLNKEPHNYNTRSSTKIHKNYMHQLQLVPESHLVGVTSNSLTPLRDTNSEIKTLVANDMTIFKQKIEK